MKPWFDEGFFHIATNDARPETKTCLVVVLSRQPHPRSETIISLLKRACFFSWRSGFPESFVRFHLHTFHRTNLKSTGCGPKTKRSDQHTSHLGYPPLKLNVDLFWRATFVWQSNKSPSWAFLPCYRCPQPVLSEPHTVSRILAHEILVDLLFGQFFFASLLTDPGFSSACDGRKYSVRCRQLVHVLLNHRPAHRPMLGSACPSNCFNIAFSRYGEGYFPSMPKGAGLGQVRPGSSIPTWWSAPVPLDATGVIIARDYTGKDRRGHSRLCQWRRWFLNLRFFAQLSHSLSPNGCGLVVTWLSLG